MVSFGAAIVLAAAAVATSTGTATGTATPTATATATAPSPQPSPPARAGGEGAPPDLSLEDALAELDRQSLGIAQARSRAEEARAVQGQVRAQLVPSLSAQGSYVRNSDEAQTPPLPSREPIVIQPRKQLSASGALRVPLVVPSAWFELRAAREGARAAEESAEEVRLQLRAGFAQAAHGARAAEEVVVASERAVEIADEHARSAERRVQAGVAAPLEALRARTEQVRREGDLVRARAELERARLALGILLGRDGPVRVAVVAPSAAPEPAAAIEALAAEATARRPEVRARAAQVEAAAERVRASRARLLPQVSASGTAFASDVAYPTGEKEGWRATVDLTWPIFDGGLREARGREASAQLAGARAGAEAQRLAVVQEVQDGARDVAVARERLRLAETQRRLAYDAAESARRSFEAGVASNLDVMDANDKLYQAEVALADGRARVAQAAIGLDRALGRGAP